MKTKTAKIILTLLTFLTAINPSFLLGQPNWNCIVNENPNSHVIILPDTLNSSINFNNIKIGDYLGFFFEDENNNEVCGSTIEWLGMTTNTFLYSNTSGSSGKNGFNPDELIRIKHWDYQSGEVVPINANYVPVNSIGTGVPGTTDQYSFGGLSIIDEIVYTGTGLAALDAKVFLEGVYNSNGLMNRDESLPIPLTQPYGTAPYNYSGSEIINSIPADMIDWVLLELRSGVPNTTGTTQGTVVVEQQAAILKADGSIVSANINDGMPVFANLQAGQSYYVCVRHRNHLDVISSVALSTNSTIQYDFTTGTTQGLGNFPMAVASDNKTVMYMGDFNHDGVIQATDYDLWRAAPAINGTYSDTDANLDGTVQVTDFDKWFKNRTVLGIVEIRF